MLSVRHLASPVSPGCTVASTLLQSVTVKGEAGSCMVVSLDQPGAAWRTLAQHTPSLRAKRRNPEMHPLDAFWIASSQELLAMTGRESRHQMIRRSLHDQSGIIHPQIFADLLSPLVRVKHHETVRAHIHIDQRKMQLRQKPERLAPIRAQRILAAHRAVGTKPQRGDAVRGHHGRVVIEREQALEVARIPGLDPDTAERREL